MIKFKLEYLKFGFVCKKKNDINTDENFFASLEFDFFRVQLKFAFKVRPYVLFRHNNPVSMSLFCLSHNLVYLLHFCPNLDINYRT